MDGVLEMSKLLDITCKILYVHFYGREDCTFLKMLQSFRVAAKERSTQAYGKEKAGDILAICLFPLAMFWVCYGLG